MLRSLAGSVKRNWALLALVVGLILVLIAVVALITGTELALIALLLAASVVLSGLALIERQGTRIYRNARRIHKSVVDARSEQRASGVKTRATVRQTSSWQRNSIRELRSSINRLQERLDDVAAQQHADNERLVTVLSDMEGARRMDDAIRANEHIAALKQQEAFQNEVKELLRDRLDVAEATALFNLFQLLPIAGPLTLPTNFTASPRTMLSLITEVLSRSTPPAVVECGSGASTVWLAAACQRVGGGSVVALEHHPSYAHETTEMVRLCGLSEFAEVRYAPLQPHTIEGEHFEWYDSATYLDLDRVDLLFVDGPPGKTGPLARYPALPQLAHALTPGALVVVDDIERPQETEVVRRWSRTHPFDQHLVEQSRAGRAALMRWQDSADASAGPT